MQMECCPIMTVELRGGKQIEGVTEIHFGESVVTLKLGYLYNERSVEMKDIKEITIGV